MSWQMNPSHVAEELRKIAEEETDMHRMDVYHRASLLLEVLAAEIRYQDAKMTCKEGKGAA